ncbi:MAG: hypothetical protein JNN16_02750 [Nitrospira sp.]|nr:hypothetical protein [Nitrospira sp.]
MRGTAAWTITHLTVTVAFLAGMGTAEAKIVVPPTGSVIEVDQPTLTAVLSTFEQAEEAIKAHDLDKVMAMYSPHYNLFTKMTMVGAGRDAVLEATCTGHLRARSKTSGLYVPIDSWYEEIHYLVREEGAWRLRGNLGESPRVLPFGTAPHPLL